jgi:hypothetical protein
MGAFVAKAFLDSRHLDISFHWVFLEQVFHVQTRDENSREYRLLMIKVPLTNQGHQSKFVFVFEAATGYNPAN